MNYDEFKLLVKENISRFFTSENRIKDITLKQICKNGADLDGLIVSYQDINIAPVIYLNNYYESNLTKNQVLEITRHIAHLIEENMPNQSFETGWLSDFEKVKNLIVPKVVCVDGNEKMLENLIYTPAADLAVIYSVYLDKYSNATDCATIPISHAMAEKWGVRADVLAHLVKNNLENVSPEGFHPCLRDMADVIPVNMKNAFGDMERDKMYIISNRRGINGAAVFMDDQFMDHVKAQLGEDFYLLPSSIHEMICVRNTGDLQVEELENMVTDVNQCEIAPKDKLSDHVYKYDCDRHEIYRADQELKRQEELNASQSARSHISR